jgi:hypothetical protein
VKAQAKTTKQKAPWRCPKCGREFAQRLAFHSCGNYTVEGYLEGKNPAAVALFQMLVKTAQTYGPITLSPAKTQVSFRRDVTFMMVSVAGRRIAGYLFLRRAVEAPCFRKVRAVSANRHVHQFQFSDESSLRGEFEQCLAEAINGAGESKETSAKKSSAPCIGEEINALYRQARLPSAQF